MPAPKIFDSSSSEDVRVLVEQARKASELLKALSHESRLMILCMLSDREMSVSEIEKSMNLPQATVSQQLARLRLDNLVSTRRNGRLIYYRIADTGVSSVVESLYEVFCKSPTD
ncbi:MAG: DNA-binding transcriptional ArsR family regulator [bacterium]